MTVVVTVTVTVKVVVTVVLTVMVKGVGGEGAEVKGFQFLTEKSHVSLHEGNRDNHV